MNKNYEYFNTLMGLSCLGITIIPCISSIIFGYTYSRINFVIRTVVSINSLNNDYINYDKYEYNKYASIIDRFTASSSFIYYAFLGFQISQIETIICIILMLYSLKIFIHLLKLINICFGIYMWHLLVFLCISRTEDVI